jgi:hypothetical protein
MTYEFLDQFNQMNDKVYSEANNSFCIRNPILHFFIVPVQRIILVRLQKLL